jgi:endonuclease/exonuclease/phosphatase family metal-dependent hydrolase
MSITSKLAAVGLAACLLAGCQPAALAPLELTHRGAVLPAGYELPAKGELRIATWNVEHFVDGHDNPYIDNRFENSPAPDELALRRALIGRAIVEVDADILVLQEFESVPLLQDMARKELEPLGYRFFAGPESTTWHQNVVVASRLPLGVLHDYSAVYTPIEGSLDREGRPETQSHTNNRLWTLEVLPDTPNHLIVAGVHLKAGRTERDQAFRAGQLVFLQGQLERLDRERPGIGMIVLGDFNCEPDAPELQAFMNPSTATAPRFVSALEGTGAFSHPAREPRRLIDNILVRDTITERVVPGSALVVTPLGAEDQQRASDHLPVVSDIRLF